MILTTIYERFFTVWISFPASASWSGGRVASSRRTAYFTVAESWEGGYLYEGDAVYPSQKR